MRTENEVDVLKQDLKTISQEAKNCGKIAYGSQGTGFSFTEP